jgi:Domain of unknown function (DUF5668)
VADRRADRSVIVWGLAFILAGVVFLLDRLEVWSIEPELFAPVALILIGVAVLAGARRNAPPRP